MFRLRFNSGALVDLSWWHWALTAPLLAAHLAGKPWALPVAIALCAAAGCYAWNLLRHWKPMPVQVRLAYLGLLVGGMVPGLGWFHWVQLVGTSAMVTFGYCPLVRMLNLAPLNRTERFSPALVWRVFVRDPVAGGLLHRSADAAIVPASCALTRAAGLGNPL